MSTHRRISPTRVLDKSYVPTYADFPFRTIEKLRFADTDQNGHITNSEFAICCQNARMELLCDPRRVPLPSDSRFVIAKLVLEFRAELHWPGTVEIGTRVNRVGQSSVTLVQGLFVDQRCVAIAESVVALMDKMSRRSVVLPDATAQALSAFSCATSGALPREVAHMNGEDRTGE